MKELSYAVRLCHLNVANADGTPASSFGFEITGDPEYEHPIITQVEPKSPGEQSGLQVNDILLKVNKRKTKGGDFEKIKKLIDKAKRDGRIEMLVVDKDAFHYCIKTNRKFKEPYIKVKHIFPRTRSSIIYQSLPSMAARASLPSQVSFD
jgi:C-terminal processing protease CtpA/Prc